jgi:hypothetical protein
MNKDAEAINQFLAWLMQPDPAHMSPSGKVANPFQDLPLDFADQDWADSGAMDLQSDIDPLDSEIEALQAELPESSAVFVEDISSLELGEIPAVQDRFHALIKRRLRAEIERNPPLFPWETRLLDYEAEQTDWATVSPSFWGAQLQALKLPVAVPETLLQQIFAECRKLAQSSLKEGVKLVRAVETLFPDDLPALNQWAGQVLLEPARSANSTLAPENLPQSYEQANPTQQMVLSLLTARRLLEAMTLKLSADQQQSQRQWQTAVGEITLTADFLPETTGIRVQAQLPTAGRLRLNGESSRAAATCTGPDLLAVELDQLELEQTYALEVELEAAEAPLVFAVVIEADL